MASCEKCWVESEERVEGCIDEGHSMRYKKLVAEHECTPEQQANNKVKCPVCGRKTIHQYVGTCTVPLCTGKLD